MTCQCGHGIDAHDHQRWWLENCALCGCQKWHRQWSWRLAGRVGLQVVGGVAAFAVVVTAGAWGVYGLARLFRAI